MIQISLSKIMNFFLYFFVLVIFYACNEQADTNASKNSIENFLSDKVQSLNLKDTNHKIINNIVEGDPLEVIFTNADTLLYKVKSDYMIVDSLDNVNFLNNVKVDFFLKETCDLCEPNRLYANKAILDSKSNTMIALSSSNERAKIELEDSKNYILIADTIQIFNNELEDLQLIKAIGNVVFDRGEEGKMTGSVFVSDFKMEDWEFFNPSGEVKK